MWSAVEKCVILTSVFVFVNGEKDHDSSGSRLPRTGVVSTKYGQVQGRVHRVSPALPDVEIFQGIRYATPPIGSNRYNIKCREEFHN